MEILKLNLQLFSEEKTEDATPKKRKEAREKGQVLQSRELGLAIGIITVFAAMRSFGKYMLNRIMGFTITTIENHSLNPDVFNVEGITKIGGESLMTVALVVGPVAMVALFTGLLLSYLQVGFLFTTKTLELSLNKLNPIEGAKKVFSKRAIVELLKSLFKIVVLGYIIYNYALSEINIILNSPELEIEQLAAYVGEMMFSVALRIGGALVVMSIFDFIYQRYDYEKNLKMSKQEIKEEHKQVEGNPQIKSKIKQKQREMALNRMMQEVPSADVIITNPTHFAVGIRYDKDLYDAPYVIAKGQDNIAQKIKELAKENNVAVVENKPLARSLYSSTEIGQVIPEELFQSVAEVLAYVYSLKDKGAN